MNGPLLAIDAAMIAIAAWIAIGLAGVAALRSFRVVAYLLLPASAVIPGSERRAFHFVIGSMRLITSMY